MVVSSGFLDHAAEVYLRANGLIMSAPPITSLNRGIDWSQSTNQLQQQQTTNQLPTQQLNQQPPPNSSVMQTISTKVSNGQQAPARVILVCHSNSHAFQTRNILLEPLQEVKVGRSVPRSRVEESNAIFDCKVLSRNHAVIWFVDGKFFIKDTLSSNGTFINSQRIRANEPYEISSGDIVQFGVDVTENTRKETHGCIIAVLKLIGPDGVEKSASQQCSPSSDQDIFRLKQIMHESYLRELILEEKLDKLQKEVLTTRTNSSNTWQAMIHEDLLLSRIDILENKLSCYQKNITNEKLLEEIVKLQDDKENYQKSAKEALKKVYQDRMAVIQKFTKFEQLWQASESELGLLRNQLVASKENNEKLSQEMINSTTENIRAQLAQQESDCKAIKESFEAAKRENEELKNRLQIIEAINEIEMANSEDDENKNITMWNNQAILHWLNNSDLKHLKGSEDIISAMCNDSKVKEIWKIDMENCSQLYEKLLDIENKLSVSDNKKNEDSIAETPSKTEDSISTINDSNENNKNAESKGDAENNTLHDGNQNKQVNDDNDIDVSTVRNIIADLKAMYNEFLTQIKLKQKDLIRAAKYDELESKIISTMLELQKAQQHKVQVSIDAIKVNQASDSCIILKSDTHSNTLGQQKTITDVDDASSVTTIGTNHSSTNSVNTETNSDSIEDLTESSVTNSSITTQIDRIEYLNGNMTADRTNESQPHANEHESSNGNASNNIMNIDGHTDNNHYDYAEEKAALESFDRIIEEECALINETDILREEELVALKERCVKLTDDNLSLRKELETLRVNNSKWLTMVIYTASIAVLIGYLLSLIFS